MRAGLPELLARRMALIQVGGIEQVKERVRDVRVGVWFDGLRQDLRYAVRTQARAPLFTGVVVISLALGIGLNTAIFSAVHAVLLQPLPYSDPARLVTVRQRMPGVPADVPTGLPLAVYLDVERNNDVFERMAVYDATDRSAVLRDGDRVERLNVLRVSASFFAVLGVQPGLGRTFAPAEDKPGSNVAVISHPLWVRRWGGDPAILGRIILLDNIGHQVVGIMPPSFRTYHSAWYGAQGTTTDIWLSDPFARTPSTNRFFDNTVAIARLKPGTTLDQARTQSSLLVRRAAATPAPEGAETDGALVQPMLDDLSGTSRAALLLTGGVVGFVLLITMTNLGTLLLARATARGREIGLRAALGASRSRLLRQLLTESVLLGLLGGAGALLMAFWGTRLVPLCCRRPKTWRAWTRRPSICRSCSSPCWPLSVPAFCSAWRRR